MAGAPDASRTLLMHATAIALDGRAALIVGASGSGKSDLALRALMLVVHDGGRALDPRLVADDQVLIEIDGERLACRAPASIAGLIEVRGLGILQMPHVSVACVALVAVLDQQPIERLPEPATRSILGHAIREVRLAPFEASAPLKLLLALSRTG